MYLVSSASSPLTLEVAQDFAIQISELNLAHVGYTRPLVRLVSFKNPALYF